MLRGAKGAGKMLGVAEHDDLLPPYGGADDFVVRLLLHLAMRSFQGLQVTLLVVSLGAECSLIFHRWPFLVLHLGA